MIFTQLDKYQNLGLLILRLGLGGFFAIVHGYPKITAGPEQWQSLGQAIGALSIPVFLPIFWGFMAAFAEFAGGICFALGLFFRPATALLLINMFVASIMHLQAGDNLVLVASRPMELAVIFAAFLLIGPGNYALDQLAKK